MRTLSVLLILFSSLAWATPAQILIIRHAEKPESGPTLSNEGEAHAQLLVRYFTSCEDVLGHGTPAAIYAMAPSHDEGSVRAIQTVAPLAEKIGILPNTRFTKKEYPAMINEIMNRSELNGKTVLICWEHKVIRDMTMALGANDPGKWSGTDFDSVYRLNYGADGVVTDFTQLSDQNL